MRLKKDGTPDLRGGKPGNRGNRHATGRKRIEGQETRTNLMIYASESEWEIMQRFCQLLKRDPERAQQVIESLGTPPPETHKPPERDRQRHGTRLLASEKETAKLMLRLTRDRITAARMALDAVGK
jgi:hypothetical protein